MELLGLLIGGGFFSIARWNLIFSVRMTFATSSYLADDEANASCNMLWQRQTTEFPSWEGTIS